MKTILFSLLSKFLTVDNLCTIIGFILSKLLAWARGKDNWDILKAIISKIRGWLDTVDEVIEDDTLTVDEEKQIILALKNTKAITKVSDVINHTVNKEEN